MSNLNNIDLRLSNFTCEQDISILESVFKDFGLKEYFHAFCLEFNINRDFGSFNNFCETIKNELNLVDLDFYYICKRACLVFEGCKHNHVTYNETQIGLLYTIFSNKNLKKKLLDINSSIKESKRISDDLFSILTLELGKKTFYNTSDLHAVLIDVKQMFPYYCDSYLYEDIQDLIKNYRQKMFNITDEDVINNVFIKMKTMTWKTRWGNMKAFNRNYQKIVENLRKKALV